MLEEVFLGVVVDRVLGVWVVAANAQRALEQWPRHLARAEAGDLGAAREMADGLVDLVANLVGGNSTSSTTELRSAGRVVTFIWPRFGIDHRKQRV